MPAPRRFTQRDIADIWLYLCTKSAKEVALFYGVAKSTIQQIFERASYNDYTSNVDKAIIARATAAHEARRSTARVVKLKHMMPARETLISLLAELNTQKAVAAAVGVNIDTLRTWLGMYRIKRRDYNALQASMAYLDLDREDVILIHALAAEIPIAQVAIKFEITLEVVCDLLTFKKWGHVKHLLSDVSYLDQVAF